MAKTMGRVRSRRAERESIQDVSAVVLRVLCIMKASGVTCHSVYHSIMES